MLWSGRIKSTAPCSAPGTGVDLEVQVLYGAWSWQPLAKGKGVHRVDFEAGQLAVRQTLQEVRKTLYFHEPKSAKSRRTVALSALVLDSLKRHRAAQAAQRLSLGAGYRDLDLVLAQWDGSPWKPESISTLFRAVVRRAGLGRVRFHDLRHSHATQLLRLGVPAKVVSERLGHATIGITLDTYTHVLPGMQEDAAKKVDLALRAVIGAAADDTA